MLSDIITGNSFGADRIDYLLRDSHHAGVAYGRFDYHRLIQCMRILPRFDQESDEPALGLEIGELESSEALMLARYFMFKQVYYHPVRRAYDMHLKEFMKAWLKNGMYPTDVEEHLKITDAELTSAIRTAARDPKLAGHNSACKIENRDHFRLLYAATPADKASRLADETIEQLRPGQKIAEAAAEKFGKEFIRYDYLAPKQAVPDFPVFNHDKSIESSARLSDVLQRLPILEVDCVYCDSNIRADAKKWRNENKNKILGLA